MLNRIKHSSMKTHPDNAAGISIRIRASRFGHTVAKALTCTLLLIGMGTNTAQSQQVPEPLALTLDEALQIAYVNSYLVKDSGLKWRERR